jgi:hypothetical protein
LIPGRRQPEHRPDRLGVPEACRNVNSGTIGLSDARCVPANEQALQKCRIARKIISLQVKTQVLLTTVAGRSSIYLKAEGSKPMLIETVLFVALVVGVGAAIVKAFEMSHDVLHGPYMKRID